MLLSSNCVLGGINIVLGNACLKILEVAFQVSDTPAASRPSTSALAELTGSARLGDSHEIQNLAFRDVETQTNRIIKLHISPFVEQSNDLPEIANAIASGSIIHL